MELLQHLEQNSTGVIRKSSGFFLAPGVEVKKGQVVRNLVGLISGIHAGFANIPKTYPRPMSSIVEIGFNSILQAGGSIKIRQHAEGGDYRILEGQEKDDFIAKCDTLRFHVVEDGKDDGVMLIDIT